MKPCLEWAPGQTLCQGQADDCLGNTHLFHIKDKTPGCDSGGGGGVHLADIAGPMYHV